MRKNPHVEHVTSLIKAAAPSTDSGDAMRFAQAALNAANAIRVVTHEAIAARSLPANTHVA